MTDMLEALDDRITGLDKEIAKRAREDEVALANKMARIAWAVMTKNENYRAPAAVAA